MSHHNKNMQAWLSNHSRPKSKDDWRAYRAFLRKKRRGNHCCSVEDIRDMEIALQEAKDGADYDAGELSREIINENF